MTSPSDNENNTNDQEVEENPPQMPPSLRRRFTVAVQSDEEAEKMQRQVTQSSHGMAVAGEHVMELEFEEWDGSTPFYQHCLAGSLAGVAEHRKCSDRSPCSTCVIFFCLDVPPASLFFYTISSNVPVRHVEDTDPELLCWLSRSSDCNCQCRSSFQAGDDSGSGDDRKRSGFPRQHDGRFAATFQCDNKQHRSFWSTVAWSTSHGGWLHPGSCSLLFFLRSDQSFLSGETSRRRFVQQEFGSSRIYGCRLDSGTLPRRRYVQ